MLTVVILLVSPRLPLLGKVLNLVLGSTGGAIPVDDEFRGDENLGLSGAMDIAVSRIRRPVEPRGARREGGTHDRAGGKRLVDFGCGGKFLDRRWQEVAYA